MSDSSNKKAELSDWLAYHKSLINDVQFAKNQQWLRRPGSPDTSLLIIWSRIAPPARK